MPAEDDRCHDTRSLPPISSNLFVVGFTSTSVQILLMREIMNIAGGYELISGTFLASWLVLSAAGAALAGKYKYKNIRLLNLSFPLCQLASLSLMVILSRVFLDTGQAPSFLISFIYTFLVLVPFCLISGIIFVKLLHHGYETSGTNAGKLFSIETTGGISAGFLISIFAAGRLDTYKLFLIIISITVFYTLYTFYTKNRKGKIFVISFMILSLFAIFFLNPDVFIRRLLLPGVNVVSTNDTPYGNITTGEYSGEKSIYYDHNLLSYQNDAVEREEDIHYAMLQRDNQENVLMISGSLKSHLPEILKYNVKKLIYIERDPALTDPEITGIRNDTSVLRVYNNDAFRYIMSANESFNTMLLLLPPPSTFLLNKYYTSEFFGDAKEKMKKGGVFLCSPGSENTYYNTETINLYSSIYNSLRGVFRYVVPVVGNKVYFLASDEELSLSFCTMTGTNKSHNLYINSNFLSDDLIIKKSKELISLLDSKKKENRLAYPIACFHFQSFNFSKDIDEKIPAIAMIILAFALPVVSVKRKNMVMYFSAAALAGYELIMLLLLQLTIGNMYQLTGLIIAVLMTGLAAGSGYDIKILKHFPLKLRCVFLIIYYALIAFGFSYLLRVKPNFLLLIEILLITFIPALITGSVFRELTTVKNGLLNPAGIYSADLFGSALGFILISGITVPLFGIDISIIILSLIVFTGFLFGTDSNKS